MEMRERKQKNRAMKAGFAFLAAVGALLLLGVGASAAPALSAERQFTQPDGASFSGTMRGDEYFHFLEAQDGSILTQGGDGYWYYAEEREFIADGGAAAELAPSQAKYLIGKAPSLADRLTKEQMRDEAFQYRRPAAQAPQAEPGAVAQAVTGDQNVLIILVDFNDIAIQYESQWANLIFGGTGKTVKTFYQEATGGKVSILPAKETYGAKNDGVVRVKLNRSHPNLSFSSRADFGAVIAAASGYVEFMSYDKNGNGIIENDELHVVLVYAGYEEAYSGDKPSVWAHNSMDDASLGTIADRIGSYSCIGERQGNHMATIGIIGHELGHGLGLPDLYCLAPADERDLSGISIMGSHWGYLPGEYPGATPVLLDAYCLERLGAVTPQAVPLGQTLNTQVKSWSSSAKNTLKVASGVPNEYFLIECRNKEGFDSALSGVGGAAVYRVNTDNENNLTPGTFLVDWLWLDPAGYASEASAGYLFYSTRPSGRTYITANTKPSNKLGGSGGYSWFRFDCLSPAGPSMNVRVQPDKPGGVYAVTYNANGGSGGPAAQYKKSGEAIRLSGAAPVRTGYAFLGWSTSNTATAAAYQPNGNFALNADTALHAVWKGSTYTVTLNAAGGVSAASITVTYGGDYKALPTPARGGYTFDGWYTQAAGGAKVNPTDTVNLTGDVTLHAHWTANTYTVTLNANGGSVSPVSVTVINGGAYGALPTPAHDGHTFDGWYTAAAGGTRVNPTDTVNLTGNTTLYAHWTAIQQPKGIFGTAAKWTGAWWHYILFFIGLGFLWMW